MEATASLGRGGRMSKGKAFKGLYLRGGDSISHPLQPEGGSTNLHLINLETSSAQLSSTALLPIPETVQRRWVKAQTLTKAPQRLSVSL